MLGRTEEKREVSNVRPKIFTAVTILTMFFLVKSPCDLLVKANVSENTAVSIFSPEVGDCKVSRNAGFY
jgi:hypothetical protein